MPESAAAQPFQKEKRLENNESKRHRKHFRRGRKPPKRMGKAEKNRYGEIARQEEEPGQRKRAGIADALLCETRMLLIDEPFAGLDQDHVEPLLDLFATTAKHAIVLLATHNIPAVSRLDGQCLILHAGRLAGLIPLAAEDGEPLERRYADCLENARIEEAAQ